MLAPTTIIKTKTIIETKALAKAKNKAKNKKKKKPQTRAVKKHKRDKKEHMEAHQQNVDQKICSLSPLERFFLYRPGESILAFFERIGVKRIQHSTDTVKYSIIDALFRNASYNTQKKLSYADTLINDFIVKNEGELCVSVRNNAKNSNTDVTAERTRSHLNILGARCDVVKTNVYIGDDSTPAYYLNKNKSLNINVHQPTQHVVKALQEIDGLSLRSLESAADFEFDSKDKEYCAAAKKALTLFFITNAVLDTNKFSPKLTSENSKRSPFSYSITNPYNVDILLHDTVVKTEDGEEVYSVYTTYKDSKSKVVCYNGIETTCREIADSKQLHIGTVQRWCKRGYDTEGNPCYYKDTPVQGKKKTTCSREILIDGQLFPSVRAGADFLGVKDSSPLCRALKTTHKYKGHICEYANQQPSDTNSDKSSIEGSTTNG